MEVGVAWCITFFETRSIPSAEIGRITYQGKEIWPPSFIRKCVSAPPPFRKKEKKTGGGKRDDGEPKLFVEERNRIKVLRSNANVEIWVFILFFIVPLIAGLRGCVEKKNASNIFRNDVIEKNTGVTKTCLPLEKRKTF